MQLSIQFAASCSRPLMNLSRPTRKARPQFKNPWLNISNVYLKKYKILTYEKRGKLAVSIEKRVQISRL